MLAFLVGFALGFLGSVPAAGPLALTIVGAALERNGSKALRLAVAGATAECVWAAVALHGVAAARLQHWLELPALRVVGVVVLVSLAVSLLRARSAQPLPTSAGRAREATDFALGFFLVATNPSFPVAWMGSALFVAGLPLSLREPTWTIVAGAFVGVVAWFTLLTRIVARAGSHLRPRALRVAVRALGIVALMLAAALAMTSAASFFG